MKKNVDYLSELPPHLAEIVLAFRAGMTAEREEQERRLRKSLEYFKREVDGLKREAEVEIAAAQRLLAIFKEDVRQSSDEAARAS